MFATVHNMHPKYEIFFRAGFFLVCGFFGAALGNWTSTPASAAHQDGVVYDSVESSDFVLVGESGRTSAQITNSGAGTGSLFLYDTDGRARVWAGTYEDGDPGIVLNDPQGNAALILRLAGSQHSPVLVFKANGQDRMVLGLSMNQKEQEPFLVTFDKSGNQKSHFGVFDR